MKILHMADCHLDSVMEAHLPAATAKKRRGELLLTFRGVLDTAERNGVSLVLIAGDLFDTPTPQRSTLAYVLSAIEAHAGITFLIIEGNHDEGALRGETLPPNVVFVPAREKGELHYDGLSVYAVGYGADSTLISSIEMKEAEKNILVAHGTVGYESEEHEEIISRALLETLPIDYLALGHYHTHRAERIGKRMTACYSGVPEGRGFDEAGVCGVVLFDTDTGEAKLLPTALRMLHRFSVDITACATQHDIENAVYAATTGISEEDMVHVTLSGHYRDTLEKDLGRIKSMLSQSFYFAKVKDESVLAICPEDYKNDISLRGEFVRSVFALDLSEEDRSRVLSYGLRALAMEDPEN